MGSWVTPFKEFAKAFSHNPTRISATGDDVSNVRHDGKVAGFLYVVAEPSRIRTSKSFQAPSKHTGRLRVCSRSS